MQFPFKLGSQYIRVSLCLFWSI